MKIAAAARPCRSTQKLPQVHYCERIIQTQIVDISCLLNPQFCFTGVALSAPHAVVRRTSAVEEFDVPELRVVHSVATQTEIVFVALLGVQ